MRATYRRSVLMVVLAACVLLGAVGTAWGLPPDPDNAALLYYQGFLSLAGLDDEARTLIGDVALGKVAPDDKAREAIGQCRGGIAFAEAAAEVPACHWGFQFSKGFDALMPQLARARFLAFVLVADARVRAADGDTRGALERCLMTDEFARHIGDDTLISYLVSIAVRDVGYRCMKDVMGQASGDVALLEWLKRELATTSEGAVTPMRSLKIEREIALSTLRMENAEQYAHLAAPGDEEKQKAILAQVSEEMFARARQIYSECSVEGVDMMGSSMPYAEAHVRLKALADRFDPNDAASGASRALAPALGSILSVKVRSEAYANAMHAGVEICLQKARSGKLPATLPAGLPKDPYSGEDFAYERTGDGFVLRCRRRDLDKDKLHEFAFPVR